MDKPLVFLLDDDSDICEAVPLLLEPEFDVECASTVEAVIQQMKSSDRFIDIAIVDMWLGDDEEGGLKAIQQITSLDFPPEIIVLTAFESIENARKCMEAGAFSYVEKSGRIDKFKAPLIDAIHHALEARNPDRETVAEAIAVIDIIQATEIAATFGSDVGRRLLRDLRALIIETVGKKRGVRFIKSTEDGGYLLTYGDPKSQSFKNGVKRAVEAAFELIDQLEDHNEGMREEEILNIRIAIHYGEVDIFKGDRTGPSIAFASRLGEVNREQIRDNSYRKIDPDHFPEQDYVICSEVVSKIIAERCPTFRTYEVGLFKLKGISGQHPVYLVEKAANLQQ